MEMHVFCHKNHKLCLNVSQVLVSLTENTNMYFSNLFYKEHTHSV